MSRTFLNLHKDIKISVSNSCVKSPNSSILKCLLAKVMLQQRDLEKFVEGRHCHEHCKYWIGRVAFRSIFKFGLILSHGCLIRTSFIMLKQILKVF